MADGKFHVFQVAEFKAPEKFFMYIAATKDGSMPEVYLDCLWLQEVR